MILSAFYIDEPISTQAFEEIWGLDDPGLSFSEAQIGNNALGVWEGVMDFDEPYFTKTIAIQTDGYIYVLSLYVPNRFRSAATPMFREIMYSIVVPS